MSFSGTHPQQDAFAARPLTGKLSQNGLSTFLFFSIITMGVVARILNAPHFFLEDDAYYYKVIARAIASTGMSSFDQQTLTNGYHPLWQLIEAAMAATIGLGDLAIVVVEVILVTISAYAMLSAFASRSFLLRAAFISAFAVVATFHVARGMETSLFLCCFGLFAAAMTTASTRDNRLAIAVAAILTIGARIDSAAFVLPMLVLGLGLRASVKPMLVILAAGLVYAAVNQWIFGIAFPVSGAVKSLGGLQLNIRYLNELAGPWKDGLNLRTLSGVLHDLNWQQFSVVAACIGAVFFARKPRTRGLVLGFIIGFAAFQAKILFGSSWPIWLWYTFPIYTALWLFFLVVDERLPTLALRPPVIRLPVLRLSVLRFPAPRLLANLAGVALLAITFGLVARTNGIGRTPEPAGYPEINRLAAARFAPLLNGARVAMGDRAGTFAEFYPGPVTQLEGLVNDRAWLQAIQSHADVRPILCARGVRFVIAYDKDLGQYDHVTVPMIRPWLSTYKGPELTMAAGDEVGRFGDLAIFDDRATGENDPYLYIWRLTGCPASASVAHG